MALIEFGNFADGTIGGELADRSWNWKSPHVSLYDGGPNGGKVARLIADDSMTFPNQGSFVRIHGIGFKGGTPAWFGNEHEAWRALTIRVPSGYTNAYKPTVDEVHADNGTGPAPLNLAFARGDVHYLYVRGSTYSAPNPPGGYPFEQNLFGGHAGGTYDGLYYRHQADWQGGTQAVVLNRFLHYRLGWYFSTDPTKGWFEGWARWDGLGEWRNIVPRRIGIRTSYPDVNGDGKPIYPMMSLYYNVGGGGQNAVDLAAGAWSDSRAELVAWQDKRLGFDAAPPVARPIHDAVADSVKAASKVSATTNPNIRAALDKSNAALGLIADEVEP